MTESELSHVETPVVCVDFTELAGRMQNSQYERDIPEATLVQRIEVGLSQFQKSANPPPEERINFDHDFDEDLSKLPIDEKQRKEKQRDDLLQEYGARPGNYFFEDDSNFYIEVFGNAVNAPMPLHDSCDSMEGSEADDSEWNNDASVIARFKQILSHLRGIFDKPELKSISDNGESQDNASLSVQDENINRYHRWLKHMRGYFRKKGLEDQEIQNRIFTILMQNAGGFLNTLSSLCTSFVRDCTDELLKVNENSKDARLSLKKEEDGSFKLTFKTPVMQMNPRTGKENAVGSLEIEIAIPPTLQEEATVSRLRFVSKQDDFAKRLHESLNSKSNKYSATQVDTASISDASLASAHRTPPSTLQTNHYRPSSYGATILVAAAVVVCIAAFSLMAVAIFAPWALPLALPGVVVLKKVMIGAMVVAAAIPVGATVNAAIKRSNELEVAEENKTAPVAKPSPCPTVFWNIKPSYQKVDSQRAPSPKPHIHVVPPTAAPTLDLAEEDDHFAKVATGGGGRPH